MQMGNTLQGTLLSIPGGIEGFLPAQIGVVGAGFWVGVLIGGFKLHVSYRDFWELICMISWLVFRVIGLAPYGKGSTPAHMAPTDKRSGRQLSPAG
jgi:hypothetical protein